MTVQEKFWNIQNVVKFINNHHTFWLTYLVMKYPTTDHTSNEYKINDFSVWNSFSFMVWSRYNNPTKMLSIKWFDSKINNLKKHNMIGFTAALKCSYSENCIFTSMKRTKSDGRCALFIYFFCERQTTTHQTQTNFINT